MSNTLGRIIRLTTFGESHGVAIGGILDGVPTNIPVDLISIQTELDRRKPGVLKISSERKESDEIQILSGVYNSKTLGTPICFVLNNSNPQSKDYDSLKDVYRPSHADLTWDMKYGIRDHRGGGRSSARETASWVAAGAMINPILKKYGIEISTYVSAIGRISLESKYDFFSETEVYSNDVRCPENELANKMQEEILKAKKEQDSLGGVITCVARGVPPGLGEPVFEKLNAVLGKAVLGINAVKGIEFGSGFEGSRLRGSENNDSMRATGEYINFESNNAGGILGGISSGADICFRAAFKPAASIGKKQETVDSKGENIEVEIGGRHDPCVVPRAVPIVQALVRMVLVDFILLNKLSRFKE
jgi:chorismate synthase